jgi:hypothetical protein
MRIGGGEAPIERNCGIRRGGGATTRGDETVDTKLGRYLSGASESDLLSGDWSGAARQRL